MVPPTPDIVTDAVVADPVVADAVVEAAMGVARTVGVDVAVVATICADLGFEQALVSRADLAPSVDDAGATAPIGWAIGVAHQKAESRETRRTRGAFYTPLELARGLVALVVDASGRQTPSPRVCDPTCGAGGFLLCAAEQLLEHGVPVDEIGPSLIGFDIDPVAILAARLSLGLWLEAHGGDASAPLLEVHDAIHGSTPPSLGSGFDVIVGNPPFLGQLRRRSVRSAAQKDALSSSRGYADAASVALERSLDWVGEGGRIALIQPQSLLAARDAKVVRSRIDAEARLFGLWVGDRTVFDASVRVCAPIIEKRRFSLDLRSNTGSLTTFRGAAVEVSGEVEFTSWPELLADIEGVPILPGVGGARTGLGGVESLSALATPAADFRDWFYQLAACVGEAVAGDPAGGRVPVFTSGLIDPLAPLWGVRSARIGGNRWVRPSVVVGLDPDEVDASERLVPKILIANQTRCIEAVVDFEGKWLANTPVITVVPQRPGDLWLAAAVILAPVSTVVAHRVGAGSALSSGAVRLTAKMIGGLPLPQISVGAWDQAAELVEETVRSDLDSQRVREQLIQVGRLMQTAYGLGDRDDMLSWWVERLPRVVTS